MLLSQVNRPAYLAVLENGWVKVNYKAKAKAWRLNTLGDFLILLDWVMIISYLVGLFRV